MADVDKRLALGSLVNGAESVNPTIYTVGAGKKVFIKAVTFCNPTATDLRITLTVNNIALIWNHLIRAFDTLTIPFLDQVVHEGEVITATSTKSEQTVLYYISGREVDA